MHETIRDVLKRHPSFDPAHGVYDDAPSIDEIHAANIMTPKDAHAAFQAEIDQLKALGLIDTESENDRESAELRHRTMSAGIPQKYSDVPLDSRYNDLLNSGRWIYIHGGYGSGKTWLACSIARGWMGGTSGSALFTTAAGFISEVMSSFNSYGGSQDVLTKYGSCKLLVIDDIGQEKPTEYALSQLQELINTRYSSERPTIFTSQYDIGDLGTRYAQSVNAVVAPAIVTRIIDVAEPISTGNRNRRLEGRRADVIQQTIQ